MKNLASLILLLFVWNQLFAQPIIIDHTKAKLDPIPESAINAAKANLHIAYAHTSHGNQIMVGMTGLRDLDLTNLVGYKGDIYNWNEGGSGEALDIDNNFVSGDLGSLGDLTWVTNTRTYLNNAANSNINVVMWSWCGGVSVNTEEGINTYLNAMNQLETDYPAVKFVYMTGHLDGTGISGNLHLRNEQIRAYCRTNNKILFDFADIESYDPSGNYFLDKGANDGCLYDADGNGSKESNWATEWQNAHVQNTDWFYCEPDHTEPLNGNLKAYAAWWLWARLAGWDDGTTSNPELKPKEEILVNQIYPNPSFGNFKIKFELENASNTTLKLMDPKGSEIKQIQLGKCQKGINEYEINTGNLKSGAYYLQICTPTKKFTKKLIVK